MSDEKEKLVELEGRMHSEISTSQDQLNSERSISNQLRTTLKDSQSQANEWLQKEMQYQKQNAKLKDQKTKSEQERDQLSLTCKQKNAENTTLQQ